MTAARIAGLIAGAATAAAAVTVPEHHDFTAHMTGHLLLGMVAPLLLVLAAPVTLLLRALPVGAARRLSRLLNSGPVRVVSHPVTAAVLNAGGLWLLYTTGIYHTLGDHPAVHFHVLAAGYLFTASVVGVDPAPHRPGFPVRAAALTGFLAAHAILAKHLYGHPPSGVPMEEARAGAELMYYGGDLADLALIVVFCHQWYRAAGPERRTRHARARWRLPDEFRKASHTLPRPDSN